MTPDEMLDAIHEDGQLDYAGFHDGLDGYFGWKIRHGENQSTVLTARFYRVEDDMIVDESEQRWLMIPVNENVEVAPPATRIEEPLDEGAVVLDADGDRWTRYDDRWCCDGHFPLDWPSLDRSCGPLTLPSGVVS